MSSYSDKMCKVSVWCFYVVCLIILLVSTKENVDAEILSSPSKDFSRHRVVQPTVHHARTKREITTTRHKPGTHHSDVTIRVQIDDEEYVLDLRLNKDLVTEGHVIRYKKNGKTVMHRPKIEDLDICQYTGTVRGKPNSWVAVSTCRGVRGVIYDGKQMRYIQPVQDNDIQADHYVYDHADLVKHHKCGYEGGVTKNESYDPQLFKKYMEQKSAQRSRISRYKRSTEDTQVRGPYNANKFSRYVELALVSDHREYQANGESLELVHHQLKDVANIINSVYAPLNIFIALVGVVVWTEGDEIILDENGDDTLNHFLTYRKINLLADIPNDNAHLITRQKFKEGVVGKALKGPICTYNFSGGVATNHSNAIGLVATTIAHEMGHNFGMEHDTELDCTCPDEKCIMNPSSTSVMPIHWSSCSLKSLALAFERGMDYCLRNKPKRIFDSPTCGNGFVEPGEQCDCGTAIDDKRNPCHGCCDPATCMLRHNATCATGACCDLDTCRPKSAGTECRSADRECDLPEFCTGFSEYCPADVYKMDSTPCSDNQAYCVQGSCRTHGDQCRLLWGLTGENSDQRCYVNNNVKGNRNGNCGLLRARQMYRSCALQDSMCGLLHCRHLNERLEFGMDSIATPAAVFINNNGTIIPCRTAMIDFGLSDIDPGLVPDGAKCGTDRMCLSQKCVSVETVRASVARKASSVCPSNCSDRGVCNSEGHCHCDAGFSPPLCALPGPGGSVDSGPATNPDVQRNFMIAMYVIFLGIVPGILLVLFLVYYSRHNVLFWWKKPRKSAQSPKKASLQQRISRSASKFAANFHNSGQNSAQPVVHTLSNPDDMNSSLLRSDSDRSPAGNINPTVNFFGNFKGFSLTPVEKQQENETASDKPKNPDKSAKITPVHRSGSNVNVITQGVLKPVLRSVPPLPIVPAQTNTIKRTNSSVQNKIKAFMASEKTEELHPVQSTPPPRPVISSPILEASTCTAKELISPLQGSKTLGPIRVAPTVPSGSAAPPQRPLSMHLASNVPQKPLPEEPKKVKEGISLNRITSFLKKEQPKEKERNPVERSHSLPKNPIHQVRIPKATDKMALRNLQISNPILQKQIDLPVNTVPVVSDSEDGDDPRSFVNRAQSMRAPASQKPAIQSFGSMRQAPGAPRPLSMAGRPTAPPPPLPNNEPNQAIYQNPKPHNDTKTADYVDCIEEKTVPLAHIDEESGDNIYAIIEESPLRHSKPLPGMSAPPLKTIPQSPPEGYNAPKSVNINSGSTESMGLLDEIVNEIQIRNSESIYSTSTLSRKKPKDSQEANRDSTYMNTDNYRAAESVYSNSGAKSNASTTSSGYLHPSAVNVPSYLNKDNQDSRPETEKAPPSPTLKANSKIPTFSRQVTPPGLKNTSTFKSVPQSPKNTNKSFSVNQKALTNSPDVVSSCAVDTKNKAPDVINNNKLPSETPKGMKPSVVTKQNDNRPPLRPAPSIEKKPTLKTAPALKPVNANTNVNKTQDKNPPLNRVNSKVDSNVKSITENINKNKPKVVPKPSVMQRTDSNVKTAANKLTSKPSNVASLQQKFENRKSLGKEIIIPKK